MEAGQGLAVEAGKQILQSGDIYAPIAVILGLALLGSVLWHVWETKRLNKELLESERQQQGRFTNAVERHYRAEYGSAGHSDYLSERGTVMRFPWFRRTDDDAIKKAREEVRLSRGVLATKLTELDQHRHLLDEMVMRSLNLMETKK